MTRVLVLSHRDIAHELGHLEPWLEDFTVSRWYREDGSVPEGQLASTDLLLVMGSPTSVATGHRSAPAQQEIDMVRAWVAADRPYLGLCFGAQVLAVALGGQVTRLDTTYRGYTVMSPEAEAPAHLHGPWVTWHEDAITADSGTQVLGRLPHADVAIRRGRAWGLQPHVEVTVATLERMGAALGVPSSSVLPLAEALAAADVSPEPPGMRVRALLEEFAEATSI